MAGSEEMCRRIGYDIPVWIEEGLVDILILGGGAVTDASLEVASFVEMCRDRGIAVYAGFDSGLPDPFVGPEALEVKDRMRTRAIASRYHRAGADGIYVFNWHAQPGHEAGIALADRLARNAPPHGQDLRGHPSVLSKRKDPGAAPTASTGSWARCRLPSRKPHTDAMPAITLDIADDVERDGPSHLELRVRLDQWVVGDRVRVCLDGRELEAPEFRYCVMDNTNPPGGAFQPSARHPPHFGREPRGMAVLSAAPFPISPRGGIPSRSDWSNGIRKSYATSS